MLKQEMPIRIFLIVLGFYCLTGCVKKDAQSKQQQGDGVSGRITAWLDLQKAKVSDNKAASGKKANIDLVKENVDLSAAGVEHINSRMDIMTIPIKDKVIAGKHLDGNASLALLLFMDKSGTISSGSLVYFQPDDHQKHGNLPLNTFANLLNRKGTVLDGKYKMLDVTGKWLSQFEAQNGRLSAAGNLRHKSSGQPGQRTTACYEWYLTTTHFYTDGTTETTEVYLGMSCDGCSSTDFATLCSEDPGSGGGGTGSSDEIIEGDDDAEESSGYSPDPSGGLDLSGAGLVPITFSGHVRYVYNRTLGRVLSATGSKPTVAPVSQPFTDDNGDPAVVYYNVGPWDFSWFLLTPATFYAAFTFDLVRTYVFVNITKQFTFAEGFSKVVNCL